MYNLNYKLNQMFQNDPKRQREEIEAQADLQASRTREPDTRAGHASRTREPDAIPDAIPDARFRAHITEQRAARRS